MRNCNIFEELMVDLQKLQVVILCGGEGLRFQNVFSNKSKVMASIGNRPLLWHILSHYAQFKLTKFILCVRDSDYEIEEYFKSVDNDWEIQIVKTGEETQTGGRLLKIKDLILDDTFMLTYGDGLANVDCIRLLNYHTMHKHQATLTAVKPINQYGVLQITDDSVVSEFIEKPVMSDWVNGGFFVFNTSVLTLIDPETSLENGLLKQLAELQQLKAFKHTGFWKSMDTFKDYQELNRMWDSRNAPWLVIKQS